MTVGTKLRKMWLQSVRTDVLLNATSSSSMASSSSRSASLWRYSNDASFKNVESGVCQRKCNSWQLRRSDSGCQRSGNERLSHLCDQIGVADNGSHKETVVGNLRAHFHTRCAQVQVHLVVGTWDGGQGKITHAVELQLESQRWFQMTIDPVFLKLLIGRQSQTPSHWKS